MADSCAVLGVNYLPPHDSFPKEKAAAIKALEIDETLVEAHGSPAGVHLFYDWDWPGAGNQFRHAIELSPSNSTVRTGYAYYLELMGRPDEAIVEIGRAMELDPLALVISLDVGIRHDFARRYDRAIEHYQETLEIDPDPLGGWMAARIVMGGHHWDITCRLRHRNYLHLG